jgi:hypothetical protein
MTLSLVDAGDLVSKALLEKLHDFGLHMIFVSEDEDEFGRPVLWATLHFKPNAPKLDTRRLMDSILAAEATLAEHGDGRPLFFQPSYDDGPAADNPLALPKRRPRSSVVS